MSHPSHVVFCLCSQWVGICWPRQGVRAQSPKLDRLRDIDGTAGGDFRHQLQGNNSKSSNPILFRVCCSYWSSIRNYLSQGHPFMESLWENRSLFYSIAATSGFIFAVALNLIPEFQSQFQMVHFPDDVGWMRLMNHLCCLRLFFLPFSLPHIPNFSLYSIIFIKSFERVRGLQLKNGEPNKTWPPVATEVTLQGTCMLRL